MRFGPVPPADALGAVLAHSIRLEDGVLKKGRALGSADVERLVAAGIEAVTVARLEAGDLAEDAAAARVAAALALEPRTVGLSISAPFTGRANLYAARPGLFRVDAEAVHALNALDEAVTLATLPDHSVVAQRRMVATVKIIPYAAPAEAVARAEALVAGRGALSVAPFRIAAPSLILTRTPGMRAATLEKGAETVLARLRALGLPAPSPSVVAHETGALSAAIAAAPGDLVLVLAASATTDRRDVTPAAILEAGGTLERLGMPVDPGNLLALGRQGGRPVLGLPGCAKSPKLNGADWVLERLAAGVAVSSADIARMGVGGLLKEIAARPEPRIGMGLGESGSGKSGSAPRKPFVSAVLLAAGASSRMGGKHKLLEEIDGVALVRRSAERLLGSGVDEVVAVLGAEGARVAAALSGLGLRTVENALWREGMGTSIAAGLRAAAPEADAALIALADMPETPPEIVERMIAAFDPEEGRSIVRPVGPSGRPGHPVLFGRRFFEPLGHLGGDDGAKAIVREHADQVVDVATENPGVEIDLDTPEAWAAYRQSRG
ncbi:MAG: molybdopterin-binding/glycosyltransferase family 2 protein [Pseudomonadota bacterium]